MTTFILFFEEATQKFIYSEQRMSENLDVTEENMQYSSTVLHCIIFNILTQVPRIVKIFTWQ